MSFWKKSPQKCTYTQFCQNLLRNFSVEKSSQKIRFTYLIFKKLPKETSSPIGENSHNLVTLEGAIFFSWEKPHKRAVGLQR
jgi:hypothetical protein